MDGKRQEKPAYMYDCTSGKSALENWENMDWKAMQQQYYPVTGSYKKGFYGSLPVTKYKSGTCKWPSNVALAPLQTFEKWKITDLAHTARGLSPVLTRVRDVFAWLSARSRAQICASMTSCRCLSVSLLGTRKKPAKAKGSSKGRRNFSRYE